MEDKRPYWKVIVSLTFSVFATFLFIYIGYKAILLFMPFVIGWILAGIANPMTKFLEKQMRIKRKIGSAIVIVFVLAMIIGVLYMILSALVSEMVGFAENIPQITKDVSAAYSDLIEKLPRNVQNLCATIGSKLGTVAETVLDKFSGPAVNAAGDFIMGVPSAIIAAIVTVLSAYFFVADREEIYAWVKKVTPTPIKSRMTVAFHNLKYAVGGYFKAQLKIMLVVFLILFVGFTLLDVEYTFLIALLIAFLDFLPFFGTGTAMIPWVLYKVLVGDYRMAVPLFIIYAVSQLTRQLIQPKLLGDTIGMNPMVTLVFIYLGYQVGSVIGMILAVPLGLLVINMYKIGSFDYILDDVKILIRAIIRLRKE